MKKYRWNNVYEWLDHAVTSKWDTARIQTELLEIAKRCDPDDLQEMFQLDMEKDGYFTTH